MHKHFLLSALKEAMHGCGLCAPNPSVGAVAVKDNAIIAQAWHHGPGKLHAEPLVLAKFPANTPNVTLYVTLEPCNHFGRTPPCVEAIIQHGIERVVFAYYDPNPLIKNRSTTNILQEHGIEVIYYPLAEIDAFYHSYSYWTKTKLPWVKVKMAQSLDGKIAGENGARVQLSNTTCAQFTHQQRRLSDIILTTAATINHDDPLLNARLYDRIVAKRIAIIDQSLSVNPSSQIFATAQQCHIYHNEACNVVSKQQNCVYYPMPLFNQQMNLALIIQHLGALGYHDVWVEVGGKVFTALHILGLVNQTYLYIAPSILGVNATPAYYNCDFFAKPHTVAWQSMDDNMMMIVNWQENTCLQE